MDWATGWAYSIPTVTPVVEETWAMGWQIRLGARVLFTLSGRLELCIAASRGIASRKA